MGVDIVISGASLGKVESARCRPFRPGAPTPVLIVEKIRQGEFTIRRIFPLESLVLPLLTPDGKKVSEEPASDEHFAVDVTLKHLHKFGSKEEYQFNGWVSRQEYEALRLKYPARDSHPMARTHGNFVAYETISHQEQIEICSSCPLRIEPYIDCEPRLFSYGTLPVLRRAVAELGSGPFGAEFADLARQLDLLFEPGLVGDNSGGDTEAAQADGFSSQAARQDASFQALFNQLAAENTPVLPKYVPESPPASGTDKLLDRLIFWKDEWLDILDPAQPDEPWLGGERLANLVSWLTKFDELVERTIVQTGLSAEMQIFQEVFQIYYRPFAQAAHYGLNLRISW